MFGSGQAGGAPGASTSRPRTILGLAAGAPPDLVRSAHLNWELSGVAITVFALVALWTFAKARGPEAPSRFPTLLIGLAYAAFGVWALIGTKDAFFAIFVVPGPMLAGASARGRQAVTRPGIIRRHPAATASATPEA